MDELRAIIADLDRRVTGAVGRVDEDHRKLRTDVQILSADVAALRRAVYGFGGLLILLGAKDAIPFALAALGGQP